jgi:hypothetical protein
MYLSGENYRIVVVINHEETGTAGENNRRISPTEDHKILRKGLKGAFIR